MRGTGKWKTKSETVNSDSLRIAWNIKPEPDLNRGLIINFLGRILILLRYMLREKL